MAEFKVEIKCMWNSETGVFDNFTGVEEPPQEEEDDEEEDVE